MRCLYHRKIKKYIRIYLVIVLCIVALTGCLGNYDNSKEHTSTEYTNHTVTDASVTQINTVENNEVGTLEITMLDVGQGLCVLVGFNNHYLLYDGGGRSSSSYVVSYLQKRDIKTLEYMIASHYDEDHISGLIGVMNTVEVKQALIPDYETDTKIYESFINTLEEKCMNMEKPLAGATYKMDGISIAILGPRNYENQNENNRSIVVRLTYQDFNCVITGDAEKEEEQYILSFEDDISADLYVVGHHGSDSSSSEEFLRAMKPKYGFISVGKDNDYGHPSSSVIEALLDRNIEIFRTDINGEISAYYDGKNVSIILNKINSVTENDNTASSEKDITEDVYNTEEVDHVEVKYVINMNSKKFHLPDCESVGDIKEHNRRDTNMSRQEILEEGYVPCKRCNP